MLNYVVSASDTLDFQADIHEFNRQLQGDPEYQRWLQEIEKDERRRQEEDYGEDERQSWLDDPFWADDAVYDDLYNLDSF